jgi:heptosyltransferase-2
MAPISFLLQTAIAEKSSLTNAENNPQAKGPYRYVRRRWCVLFAVIDWIGAMLKRFFGKTPSSAQDTNVILLVQLDHLGDAIITTAMLPLLREQFPHASIEVLAAPWNAEVFHAATQVDRVYVSRVNRFARSRLARLGWIAATFYWAWKLRRRKVDLGIDVRGEFPMALMLWLGGARRRLGWNCGGGRFLLTDSPRYVPDRPELQSRMALLAELLPEEPNHGQLAAPEFHVDEQTLRRMARAIATDNRPLAVLHIAAGTAAKQWTTAGWQELLWRLTALQDTNVVLVGGKNDRAIADEILQGEQWPRVADWTGRMSIVELAAAVQMADVFVGADSGPAHLAAAVDTPAVVLFSGTNDQQQWQPRGRRVKVLRAEVACSPCHRYRCNRSGHPCMSRITPLAVFAAVEEILESRRVVPVKKTAETRMDALYS